jgi:DNA-binding IclR family transcriptional regulator
MEKTAAKAFAAFEALCKAGGPVSVTALANVLGLNKSNVHRLLGTLVELGYARRNDRAGYEPSLKVWELGQSVWARNSLTHVAGRHLENLTRRLDHTVLIAVLDGDDLLYVDKRDGNGPVRLTATVGRRVQPHCSATGKVLLAFDPLGAARMKGRVFQRLTPHTIGSVAQLEATLVRVRSQGYAVNRDELVDGLSGVAVPIRNSSGAVVAALGTTMLTAHLPRDRAGDLVPELKAAADGISFDLGWRGPTTPVVASTPRGKRR